MLLNKKRIRNSDPPWVYEHFKTGYQRAQLFEENPSSGIRKVYGIWRVLSQ